MLQVYSSERKHAMEHLNTQQDLGAGSRFACRIRSLREGQEQFRCDFVRSDLPGQSVGRGFTSSGRLRTLSSIFMLGALLAACAPMPRAAKQGWRPSPIQIRTADYGAYPSDYETIVKGWYLRNLKDPDSARFGRITRPLREHAIRNQFRKEAVYGYSVCARVNARNSFGGYTGFKTRWFLIRNGRIVRISPPRFHIYIGRPYRCIDGPKTG